MDIVRFKGGLGNQMFQYAFLKALSWQGRDVRGNLGFYCKHPGLARFCLKDVFPNISINFIGDDVFEKMDEQWKEIKGHKGKLKNYLLNYSDKFFWVESQAGMYDERIFETNDCTFVGYWQTEKYFKHIRDSLLHDFSFKQGDAKFERLKKELAGNNKYVSVHIRRGDYLKNPEIYGNLAETKYYKTAMEYIKERVFNPTYVFFSDDIQWVKEKFRDEKGIFVEAAMFEDYHMWYDMCLMSCCAHNIIANSSFSWWGAWINRNADKLVIAPKPWFCNEEMPDIWCDGWIKILNDID